MLYSDVKYIRYITLDRSFQGYVPNFRNCTFIRNEISRHIRKWRNKTSVKNVRGNSRNAVRLLDRGIATRNFHRISRTN